MSEILGPKPTKSYKNDAFLSSRQARSIRVQCELGDAEARLKQRGIDGTILFFGSARSRTRAQFDKKLAEMKTNGEDTTKMQKTEWMCEIHEKVTCLSSMLAKFLVESDLSNIAILTGGGPGMMEAANKGVYGISPDLSMGMGISLPFEPSLNPYVHPDLAFEFHYFFTRKFWMVLQAMSLVVAPGGVGTMDELFEVMTLQQCGKIKVKFPIILLGKEYWENVVNWQFLVERGTISQSDVDALLITDDIDAAFNKIVHSIKVQLKEGIGPQQKRQKKSQEVQKTAPPVAPEH